MQNGAIIDGVDQSFYVVLHHALILIDDWLCDKFGFSRKPKGKYTT